MVNGAHCSITVKDRFSRKIRRVSFLLRFKVWLMALGLCSCSDMVDQNHFGVDPVLRPFYDSFMEECKARNLKLARGEQDLSVGVAKLEYPHEGITYYDRKSIVINEALIRSNIGHPYNDHVDSMEVQYVVWHELAHYFLDRGHLPPGSLTIMTARSDFLLQYMHKPDTTHLMNQELFRIPN